MHYPDDKPSNWFILFNALQLFQPPRNTWAQAIDIALDGIEGGGRFEIMKKEKKKVSHQLGGSTGYEDAHQSISMRGVGIAMQRMH